MKPQVSDKFYTGVRNALIIVAPFWVWVAWMIIN